MDLSFEILFGAYRDSMPTFLTATPALEKAIRTVKPIRFLKMNTHHVSLRQSDEEVRLRRSKKRS